jgi:amidase
MQMNTSHWLSLAVFLLYGIVTRGALEIRTFNLSDASIADIQEAFEHGALTSERLVELYLARIEAYDSDGPKINAFLYVNQKSLETARELDRERAESGARGPMHGIPVVLKDVFDTYDMPTTGGFLPLQGVIPTKDATVVARLREAGAIILGKLNQSDWYARPPIVASSSLGGNTLNPYGLEYTPGWSSSGTGGAIAAWMGQVGLGSETGFSIRTPTADSHLYGISTTSGLISRDGQMWSYITGERGGPMTRSMYDLCVALEIMAGFDSFDLWTAKSLGRMPAQPYTAFLDHNGLKGVRVGVLKEAYDFLPSTQEGHEIAAKAIKIFADNGARVFYDVSMGIDLRRSIAGHASPSRFERIHAINHYLARQGPDYPIKNARQLIMEQDQVAPREWDLELIDNPVDLDRDPVYRVTVLAREALRDAVVELMDRYELDALIYPHKLSGPLKIGPRSSPDALYIPNQLSPITGLPAIIVPGGFTAEGLPIGFEILGRPWSEPTLIRIASGYEAIYGARKHPSTTPPLPGEAFEFTINR